MKVLANRGDMEVALGRALSRHVGHTTAAYDLERILSILDFFRDRPSAYKEEITKYLSDNVLAARAEKLSDEYLDGTVTFARAFGIIQQTSGREARLQKFSPTEEGRSLLAARQVGDDSFARFYAARTAFIADADSLTAILLFYRHAPQVGLLDFYVKFFLDIRQRRLAWLHEAFSEPLLRERIVEHVAWLGRPKRGEGSPSIEAFSLNTARHHATPRKGWLMLFGMLENEQLTRFGERALASLLTTQSYFWLGPPRGVQEALRIGAPYIQGGPFEDEFDFSQGESSATPEQNAALVGAVADTMATAFPFARLIHAAQASLHLPVEYIKFRSFTDGLAYDPIAVLDLVFQEHRERFDRLSALKGRIGFYRLK